MYFNMNIIFIVVCLLICSSLSQKITIPELTNNVLPLRVPQIFQESHQGGSVSTENIEKLSLPCHQKSEQHTSSKQFHHGIKHPHHHLESETRVKSNERNSKEHSTGSESQHLKSHGKKNIVSDLINKAEKTITSVKNHTIDLTHKIGNNVISAEQNLKGLLNGVEGKTNENIGTLIKDVGSKAHNLTHNIKGTVSEVENGVERLVKGSLGKHSKSGVSDSKSEKSIHSKNHNHFEPRKGSINFESRFGSNERNSEEHSKSHSKSNVLGVLVNKVGETVSSVKDHAEDFTHNINKGVKLAKENLKGLIGGVEGKVHEKFDHLKKEAASKAHDSIHNIEGAVSTVEQGVGHLVEGLLEKNSGNKDNHSNTKEQVASKYSGNKDNHSKTKQQVFSKNSESQDDHSKAKKEVSSKNSGNEGNSKTKQQVSSKEFHHHTEQPQNNVNFETRFKSNGWDSEEHSSQSESHQSKSHGKGNIIGDVINKVEKTVTSIKDHAGDFTHNIDKGIKTAEGNLKGLVTGIEEKAREKAGHLKKEVGSVTNGLVHKAGGTVSKVENGIEHLINGLTNKISNQISDKTHIPLQESSEHHNTANQGQHSQSKWKNIRNHGVEYKPTDNCLSNSGSTGRHQSGKLVLVN